MFPCVSLQCVFAGRHSICALFFCLFGQMLVGKQDRGRCLMLGVFVLCVCVWEANVLPLSKASSKMKIEHNPMRDPAVLYSACTHRHRSTHRQTHTPPSAVAPSLSLPSAHQLSTSYPAPEEKQMTGRSMVPVLGVSRSLLLFCCPSNPPLVQPIQSRGELS